MFHRSAPNDQNFYISTVNDEISAGGAYLQNKLSLGALIRQGRSIQQGCLLIFAHTM